MGRIWNTYYPEFAFCNIDRAPTSRNHETFEVLLLGGSTMFLARDGINAWLVPALERHTGRPVRVYNLSWMGRNSLDSRLKYEHLANKRFDLVLLYDGFNDVRMNNCKPGTNFRDDYSHDPRYAELNTLARHGEIGWFALPFTAEFAVSAVAQQFGLVDAPDVKWCASAGVGSGKAFENNLAAIARTAAKRGDPLVLMTFAYYIPGNYTDEAYLAGKLNYAGGFAPLNLWGTPHTVSRAVDEHNKAVRRVAERYHVRLIEQANRIPEGRGYFRDACHLTFAGNVRFVDNIKEGLGLNAADRYTPAP
jgi:hypothetical protein